MRLRRTNSFTRSANTVERDLMDTLPSPTKQLPLIESSFMESTLKRPSIHNPLARMTDSLDRPPQEDLMQSTLKQSKMGNMVRTRLLSMARRLKKQTICDICETPLNQEQQERHISRCDHMGKYCETCLLQYVIYRVKLGEEVYCPFQGCSSALDTTLPFFNRLPLDIQRQYRSYRSQAALNLGYSLKPCPNNNCNGILRPQSNGYTLLMVCNYCNCVFCPCCLRGPHMGPCQPYEVNFFQSSAVYMQCRRCLCPAYKEGGSNQLICRHCGGQFCYVCGQPWNIAHQGSHDQTGRVGPPAFQSISIEQPNSDLDSCFKQMLKIILLLVLTPVVVCFYLFLNLIMLVCLLLAAVFMGLLVFSLQFMGELEGPYFLLGIIGFPVVMVIGVGIGIKEIFWEVVRQQICGKGCTPIKQCLTSIYNL